PRLMTVPMIILAIGSVTIGWLLSLGSGIVGWLEPVTGRVAHEADPVLPVPVLMTVTLVLVALGILLAWRQYAAVLVPVVPPRGSVLTRAARKDLYQDDVNDALLVEPGTYLTRSLVFGDHQVVDGGATGLARLTVGAGSLLRRVQNGYVRSYAATMLIGLIVLVGAVLAARI
ncbi:MAG TPA: NADH-quinone oxidoreductase subunit L, partial [Cellulomonadaceae bacterium]|nr:NADH-quinone oxidoreductase subunit L [Cellulomonadaceae bacterium]